MLDALAEDPSTSALFVDFDGTLSDIVEDPGAARPRAGAVEVLAELSTRLGAVAVVSGRPGAFLDGVVTDRGVDLYGLYGLESRRDGTWHEEPAAGPWRSVIDEAVAQLTPSVPDDAVVEPKGLSLTVHYRRVLDAEAEIRSMVDEVAGRTGLVAHPAKASIELHPPVDVDKGTVVTGLAEGFDAVAYLGDDVGDRPAFEALARLRAQGRRTVALVVRTAETPDGLTELADVVVDGPAGAVEALRQLAERLSVDGDA